MRAVSSREFTEWMAYYSIEPFGQEAENWRLANLMALLTNINRGKGQRRAKPEDFMPKGPGDTAPEPDVLQKKLHALMLAWGGRVDGGHAPLTTQQQRTEQKAITSAAKAPLAPRRKATSSRPRRVVEGNEASK